MIDINMVKVLSLDTSTKMTGWGLFIDGKYNNCGLIDLSDMKETAEERIPVMISEIEDIINEISPDIIIVETTAVARNVSAQRYLTMLLGMVWHICIKNEIEFQSVRPTEWRSWVSSEKKGNKREELKAWSMNTVNRLLGFIPESDDVSDAILIGYGYINRYKED